MAILDYILSPSLQLKLADGVTAVEQARITARTEQVAPLPEYDRYMTGQGYAPGGSFGYGGSGVGGFSQSQLVGAGLIIAGVVGLVLLTKS